MTKVTVSVGSSRPGGIDILMKSLAAQTYQDFEVVFVDGRYHKRHAQVLDYAKKVGLKQPLYHVPNQRYNGSWPANCSGVNTGFMLADGEIVIMLLDYAYMPPDWIENHLKFHTKPRLVLSPHKYAPMPPTVSKNGYEPKRFVWPLPYDPNTVGELRREILNQFEQYDEISIFKEGEFDPSWCDKYKPYDPPNTDPKVSQAEGPIHYTWMHTKNESFPRDTVLSIGGLDEHYDFGKGPGDHEIGFRFWKAGCEVYLAHSAYVQCFNPREQFIALRATLPEDWNGFPPELNKWTFTEGIRYMERRIREMYEGYPPVANNPYDLWAKRDELWHWRDLSQDRDAVIPYIDIPDSEYWKGQVS